MSEQETLVAPTEEETSVAPTEEKPVEQEGPIREYIVFVETSPDNWRRLDTVVAGDPGSAVKALDPDPNKRYAAVSSRFWQVGKPKVRQITQVSIEFE